MKSLQGINYFRTSKELNTTLPTSAGGSPYLYKVVYSIKLPPLVKKGSILQIKAVAECTNPNGTITYGTVCYLCLGVSATDTTDPRPNLISGKWGKDFVSVSGNNHLEFQQNVDYQATDDIINGYINFVMAGYSSASNGTQIIIVETPDYGQMTLILLEE